MDNKTHTYKQLPAVLSFRRGLIITDAVMESILPDRSSVPVEVIRHGIRGTQNVNIDADTSAALVQETETARTVDGSVGLQVAFSLVALPLKDSLFACASSDPDLGKGFREDFANFVDKATRGDNPAVGEIARRISKNIMNARWLWRNRSLGEKITVSVKLSGEEAVLEQNALKTALGNFDEYSESETKLAEHLVEGFRGGGCRVEVRARIEFGFSGSVEVFPSQNYLASKPSGFARSLYKLTEGYSTGIRESGDVGTWIVGRAAIRDQKIGNALRTYDTWYPDFSEYQVPIPVEPNGANLDAMRSFRPEPKKVDSKSAFRIFKRVGELNPSEEDGLFLIGCIIRGGVYGESGKVASKSNQAKEGGALGVDASGEAPNVEVAL